MAKATTNNNGMEVVYTRMEENIRLLLAKYDMYPVELASLIGMCKRTFSGKRKSPWNFSLGEVELIAKALHTDPATLMFGDVTPVSMFSQEVRR